MLLLGDFFELIFNNLIYFSLRPNFQILIYCWGFGSLRFSACENLCCFNYQNPIYANPVNYYKFKHWVARFTYGNLQSIVTFTVNPKFPKQCLLYKHYLKRDSNLGPNRLSLLEFKAWRGELDHSATTASFNQSCLKLKKNKTPPSKIF